MDSSGTAHRTVAFKTETESAPISNDPLAKHWSSTSDVDSASISRRASSMATLPSEGGLSRHPSGAAMAKKASGAAGGLFRKKSSAGRLFASGEVGEANFNRDVLRSPNMREAILLKKTSEKVADEERDTDIRIFDSKEEADRLSDLVLTFVTMPALEYAKGVHGMNGMIVLHNAIRVEIENIVTMICSMMRIGVDLTVGDILAFQNWWLTSVEILHDYLEIETRVILPWIRKKGPGSADSNNNSTSESSVDIAKIPVSQSEVRKLLDAVSRGFNRSITGSPLAINALSGPFSTPGTNEIDENTNGHAKGGKRERLTVDLVVAFDRCITNLITHMANQETAKTEDSGDDSVELLGEIVDEILKSANQPDIMLVFLGRWMVDPKMRKEYEKLIREKSESSYSKLQSQYEITHGATVAVFKVKAGL